MLYVKLLALALLAALTACGGNQSQQDLENFIAENKRRPPGVIKEPPKVEAYDAFSYDAYRLRSPFEKPVSVETQQVVVANNNVRPDLIRQKEPLEQFDLSALRMVGTLERKGNLWALVSDPEGGIQRVREGNYLGRNHGRIASLSADKIELVEIVASGEAWLERPNLLQLQTGGPDQGGKQ